MSKSKKNQPRPGTSSASGKAASGKSGTSKSASASRREQLRAQQAAEAQRKRTMRIVTAAAIVLAVLIVAVVVVVVVQNRKPSGGDQPTTGSTAAQIVPPSANADKTGLVYNTTDPAADVPQVIVYMDYQCPGCAQASKLVEPKLEELADNGDILLTYHILHGLDGNYPGNNSFRAATGATCADIQGVFPEYSSTVFAGQPANEGDGWTDKQLSEDYPKLIGLEGEALSEFQTCYADRATADFLTGMQDSLPDSIKATPTFTVNGEQWAPSNDDFASADAMLQAIQKVAG